MKILVLQHVDVEHPGIFRDFFSDDRLMWDTVELDAGEAIPDVAQYDLMVVDMVMIGLIGFLLFETIVLAEKFAIPWNERVERL